MKQMWSNADQQARKTLIGAALMKFASSLAMIWGSANIYFYSYLKQHGQHIDSSTNSKILLCAIVPLCLTVPIANPFSRFVGYKNSIKMFSLLYILSPLMLNFWFTTFSFALFWMVIPITCFLMAAIPLLNCLWTQFPRDLSKVSALAVVMFSVGMIVWNLLFMQLVNPQNKQARVDESGVPFFGEQVSNNALSASNVVFMMAGVMNVAGSFMVSKRQASKLEQTLQKTDRKHNRQIKQKKIPQSNIMEGIERAVSQISLKSDTAKSLKHYLFDKRFILIFLISGLNPIYLVYLTQNIKLVYMPIINDDHFLSYCIALVTISAVVAPFWGQLCDSKGFKTTLLWVTVFDSIVKIFGVFAMDKWSLGLLFFMLGANDKGLLTIIGPGLVGMFGVEMATELIPYKGLALIIAYVLAPLMQITLKISNQGLLFIYFLLSLLGVGVTLYLKYKVVYAQVQADQGGAEQMKNMEVKQVK